MSDLLSYGMVLKCVSCSLLRAILSLIEIKKMMVEIVLLIIMINFLIWPLTPSQQHFLKHSENKQRSMKYKRLNGTGTLFILSIHSNHIWVLVNFHSTSAFSWEWMKKMCSIALAKPTLVMFQKHIAYSWCSLSSTSQNHLPLILLFLCVYVFFF